MSYETKLLKNADGSWAIAVSSTPATHLVCAVHPAGPNTNTSLDFRADPNAAAEELWEPEGASYYNGELILQPQQRWTPHADSPSKWQAGIV